MNRQHKSLIQKGVRHGYSFSVLLGEHGLFGVNSHFALNKRGYFYLIRAYMSGRWVCVQRTSVYSKLQLVPSQQTWRSGSTPSQMRPQKAESLLFFFFTCKQYEYSMERFVILSLRPPVWLISKTDCSKTADTSSAWPHPSPPPGPIDC